MALEVLLRFNMTSFLTALSFLGLCYGGGNNPYSVPVANTDSGMVSGKFLTVGTKDITAFLGIPFAQPPVGELRFKNPLPVTNWPNVLPATKKSAACMQFSSRNISWYAKTTPNEDCLYLNIWIPGRCLDGVATCPQNVPVLVWIYGGGFAAGSTDMDVYDGAVLSSTGDVIVVTMNYRVGMFGFLSAGSELAPGNMGLHDQNLAMRWISENIAYFGGDPKNITLAGESAGSVSVGLHLISPMSTGLFNRAIMQSGSPYHPILTESTGSALYKGNVIAQMVGCANSTVSFFTNPELIIACLKLVNAIDISKAEDVITQKVPFLFLPRISDDLLPMNPILAMNSHNFSDVDLLVGDMKDEGTLFLNYLMPDLFNLSVGPLLNLQLARTLIQGLFMNSTHPLPDAIADFYLRNLTDEEPMKLIGAVANSYGDFIFNCPTMFFAEKLQNVYFYDMTYRRERTSDAAWTGSPHFSDVPIVFGMPAVDNVTYTQQESQFSMDVIQKWTSFAKQGNPIGTSNETWPKFNSTELLTRELNTTTSSVTKHPRWESCDFWRPFFVPTPA